MPGYGIVSPREGRGLLPWSWAEHRLSTSYRYWIASVSPEGTPHVMPVWAIWFDWHIWFSTGSRSRKAENLRSEPRCVVHTDGEDVLVVNGVAETVAEPDTIAQMVERYIAKYPAAPPDPADNPIIRVRPRRVFGLIEAEFTTSPTRWTF